LPGLFGAIDFGARDEASLKSGVMCRRRAWAGELAAVGGAAWLGDLQLAASFELIAERAFREPTCWRLLGVGVRTRRLWSRRSSARAAARLRLAQRRRFLREALSKVAGLEADQDVARFDRGALRHETDDLSPAIPQSWTSTSSAARADAAGFTSVSANAARLAIAVGHGAV